MIPDHRHSRAVHGLPSTPRFDPRRGLRLDFVDDHVAVAARFLAAAPQTSDAIWELLRSGPIESIALHGIWAGHELAAELPPPPTPIPPENQSLYPAPGEILFWSIAGGVSRNYPNAINELAIIYGPDTRLNLGTIGDKPGNVFAFATDNLDGLASTAHRMRYEGAKRLTIGRITVGGSH